MNVLLECLLKWFAPIFVFTTEEIYKLVSNKEESIHELSFPNVPKEWENKKLDVKWKKLYEIKQFANIAIEEKRSNKEIGSSLEAEIEIITDSENYNLLDDLDLAEYFITSKAKKTKNKNKSDGTKIIVKKAVGTKCPRCWKILSKKCERCTKAIQS